MGVSPLLSSLRVTHAFHVTNELLQWFHDIGHKGLFVSAMHRWFPCIRFILHPENPLTRLTRLPQRSSGRPRWWMRCSASWS